MSTKAKDFYETNAAFVQALEAAECAASSSEEVNFVDELSTKAADFGLDTFLSDSQYQWLEKLANR